MLPCFRDMAILNATFRPLEVWPGLKTPPGDRRESPFRATWGKTLDLLSYELGRLDAFSVVIQIDLMPHEFRIDGWPKGKARPAFPGVVVSFSSPTGAMSFPCDRYTRWEDNLRAIALSLEALRAVDRYGVTRRAEQYRGFTKLAAAGSDQMTREGAAALLAHLAGDKQLEPLLLSRDVDAIEYAYNLARRSAHPDVGGSHEAFVQLQHARELLRRAG